MANGPEGAAELLRSWLTTAVPARLTRLETALALDPGEIPRPQLIAAEDRGPIGIEWWPAILALPVSTRRQEFIAAEDDGAEVYRVTYAMQVIAWVRAEDYPATSLLQRRYALAIREALLERKQLAAAVPGVEADYTAASIDPASLLESYSDVMTGQDGATIAGATIRLDLIVAEQVTGPDQLGTAGTFDVGPDYL